ncbi:hypothetical protein BpHYR1_002628 [Brachionus plicatilis]|uniref:RNA-directed DNA polymerase from mobile element jockey-like n=1 Tax=Brachionus plicatilis TaxID=10195 RepID=A0A3M7SF37_BRAPC|nr:hypothetical protein BpHYR1_002628 [Brachionus plicatilis]
MVVNDWNRLPKNAVEANLLNSFKARLDKWFMVQNLVQNKNTIIIQSTRGLTNELGGKKPIR